MVMVIHTSVRDIMFAHIGSYKEIFRFSLKNFIVMQILIYAVGFHYPAYTFFVNEAIHELTLYHMNLYARMGANIVVWVGK